MNRRVNVIAGSCLLAVATAAAQSGAPQQAVDAAYAKYKTLQEGKNADYIPALAAVDPNLFGIALVTTDGKVYTAGDVKTEVSIQSISKVFTMAQVIQEQGLGSIENRIGVDATGARFNSIIAVEAVKVSSRNVTPTPAMPPTAFRVAGVHGLPLIISANSARRTEMTLPSCARPATARSARRSPRATSPPPAPRHRR